jgi:hypothetical protein
MGICLRAGLPFWLIHKMVTLLFYDRGRMKLALGYQHRRGFLAFTIYMIVGTMLKISSRTVLFSNIL